MLNLKTRMIAAMWYLYDRATEPSGVKGLIMMFSGGGWKALDSSNKGEMLAQWGMILLGAIQFFLPQRVLYAPTKSEHSGS
jgi:hypothetical protein